MELQAAGIISARRHWLGRLLVDETRGVRLARTALLALAAAVGIVAAWYSFQLLAQWSPDHKVIDFQQDHRIARAILYGYDPYRQPEPSPGQTVVPPSAHPPTIGLLFLPLGLLDVRTSALIWLAAQIASMLAAVYLSSRAVGSRLHPLVVAALGSALLGWQPLVWEMVGGQVNVLQLLALVAAWWAFRRRRSPLFGIALGVAMMIKPLMWPLVLLILLRKDWRALAGLSAALIAAYAITIWRIGLEAHITYITESLPGNSMFFRGFFSNFSVSTIGWRLFEGTGAYGVDWSAFAPPLFQSAPLARLVSTGTVLTGIAIGSMLVWRYRHSDAAFGMGICVALLTTPIGWIHYLQFLLIPAVQVLSYLSRSGFPTLWSNAFLLAIIPALMPIRDAAGGTYVTLMESLVVVLHANWAVAGLLCMLVFLSRRGHSSSETSVPTAPRTYSVGYTRPNPGGGNGRGTISKATHHHPVPAADEGITAHDAARADHTARILADRCRLVCGSCTPLELQAGI